MKFKRGSYRLVVIFPSLGIAIKLPVVHIFRAICTMARLIIFHGLSSIPIYMKHKIDNGSMMGCRDELFGGIVANWREFMFFHKTRNPFLQPTYFSFFGFFNIQKAGELCLIDGLDLRKQLEELTDENTYDDPHHFINPKNYCFDNGKLKILDYGGKRTHRVIAEYGAEIFKSFDPSYSWEAKKRSREAQKK